MSKNKDGCEFFNHCETCPFPDCVEVIGKKGIIKWKHQQEVLRLREEGNSIKKIAEILRVTERTVYRRLAGEDEEE